MFTVTKKAKTPNMVWDPETKTVIARFTKGVFTTSNEALAEKLAGMGHTVTGAADAEEKPVEKMKLDELKAYAEANGIDLGDATSKGDILKVIQEAVSEGE